MHHMHGYIAQASNVWLRYHVSINVAGALSNLVAASSVLIRLCNILVVNPLDVHQHSNHFVVSEKPVL